MGFQQPARVLHERRMWPTAPARQTRNQALEGSAAVAIEAPEVDLAVLASRAVEPQPRPSGGGKEEPQRAAPAGHAFEIATMRLAYAGAADIDPELDEPPCWQAERVNLCIVADHA
jgi:hypothetical protein